MNKPQSFIDRSRAETLLEKWAPVLDFKSNSIKEIDNENTRLNTAILLENQEKWCFEQSGNTSALGAAAGSSQVPTFSWVHDLTSEDGVPLLSVNFNDGQPSDVIAFK